MWQKMQGKKQRGRQVDRWMDGMDAAGMRLTSDE